MKQLATMTPVQIASGIIEKLQEENRSGLEALHKAQSTIKSLQRQLADKEHLIKILEDRVRTGSNCFLEMSNRQKEITIKHLELQIQKLIKENKELEQQINTVQSAICDRCETKYFLDMQTDNKAASKSCVKKPAVKFAPGKSVVQKEVQNREKRLERILDHKDKRIFHLSKEVERLTQSEKELTNKIYRLNKLIPLSHIPSENLIECLLSEIQSLDSQLQLYKGGWDKLPHQDDTDGSKRLYLPYNESDSRKNLCVRGTSIASKTVTDKSNSVTKTKSSMHSDLQNVQQENAALVSNLHKLYSDVSELKRLFASENEKLYQSLTRDSLRNDILKIQWNEIVDRLNDIAASIQNIISINPNSKKNDDIITSETENIILRLQDRLRDSLELATQYENENMTLKNNIKKLEDQLMQKHDDHHVTELRKLSDKGSSTRTDHIDDVQHLKGLLNSKQKQLDSAESHLQTCQNFIEELQRMPKEPGNPKQNFENLIGKKDVSCNTDNQGREMLAKSLMTKLEVAEKNIKTCEEVIVGLQKLVQNLEEENIKLESDLQMAKYEKVLSQANNNQNACLKSKLKDTEDELASIHNENKNLKTKTDSLEAENSALQNNLQSLYQQLAPIKENDEEKVLLQSKLEISEKRVDILEKNIADAQNAIENLKEENALLRTKLNSSEKNNFMAYEDKMTSLRNELKLKDDEISYLKESLHTFDRKALEMSHYRRNLRQEIEKLCDVLLDKSEDSKSQTNRKAIYKAAVLHSAQALLRLDDDYNLQSEGNENYGALEEIKHQISVYLTEVSRIHELLTIKEQQREDLLRQYLDLDNESDFQGLQLSHEVRIQEDAPISGLESSPRAKSSSGSQGTTSSESGVHSANKNIQTDKIKSKHSAHNCCQSEAVLATVQEELEASKSITTYLLSKCSQLEDLLEKERLEYAKCERETEMQKNTIKDLRSQVSVKSNVAKRLNTLIEMMRSKECNDEITVEQLKSEIKWLVDENQKVFEKITTTQSELCRCKEENSRIQNDLDTLKRQLVNEKYEHAKVNNELKHLRIQISGSHSSTLND